MIACFCFWGWCVWLAVAAPLRRRPRNLLAAFLRRRLFFQRVVDFRFSMLGSVLQGGVASFC